MLDGSAWYKQPGMQDTCVTFGAFDGVHLGHWSVIDKTAELAGETLTPVAVVFDEEQVDDALFLTTQEEKLFFLRDAPVHIISHASPVVTPPEEYVAEFLAGRLGARKIVVGEGCRFGQDGAGGVELLERLSGKLGYELHICPMLTQDAQIITKERICQAYDQGRAVDAEKMLGHRYVIIGEVYHGRAQGRNIGFPTINQMPPKGKYLPKLGAYASITEVDGVAYKSMTNIGRRPSLDNLDFINFETYILDFSGNLYGKRIAVQPAHCIRDVISFTSREALQRQISRDIEAVRDFFAGILPC